MKLIVAGSRGFNDYVLLKNILDQIHAKGPIETVISGTARGADSLGEHWAELHGVSVIRCPANWERDGKSAGYKRNEEMAKIATDLVAFWDGESRGTKHMIDIAQRAGLRTTVIKF